MILVIIAGDGLPGPRLGPTSDELERVSRGIRPAYSWKPAATQAGMRCPTAQTISFISLQGGPNR
jgi:hypothetical protein